MREQATADRLGQVHSPACVSSTRYLTASVFQAPADEANGFVVRGTSEDADLGYLALNSTLCNTEAPSCLRMHLPLSDTVEKA